jgi:hypothetical protein
MSETTTQTDVEMGGTKPTDAHAWLQKLVGEWRVESEMTMPDGSKETATGSETTTSLGGLWAYGEGKSDTPGGAMEYRTGLGYDVTFKGYRGFWLASMSSHLWKYEGELSEDGKVMTLNCVGPDMMKDEGTANYRDVIEIIDENTRTLTSHAEGENGEWIQFMKATYKRV